MRHDDVSRLGVNTDNEWLARPCAIATYRLNPFVLGAYAVRSHGSINPGTGANSGWQSGILTVRH
jgi:hypothetical protein